MVGSLFDLLDSGCAKETENESHNPADQGSGQLPNCSSNSCPSRHASERVSGAFPFGASTNKIPITANGTRILL